MRKKAAAFGRQPFPTYFLQQGMLQFAPHLAQHFSQQLAAVQHAASAACTTAVDPAASAAHSATILNKRFIFVSLALKSTPVFRRTCGFFAARPSSGPAARGKRKSRVAAVASGAAEKPRCAQRNRPRAARLAKPTAPASEEIAFGRVVEFARCPAQQGFRGSHCYSKSAMAGSKRLFAIGLPGNASSDGRFDGRFVASARRRGVDWARRFR